jgi:hypothetical protein
MCVLFPMGGHIIHRHEAEAMSYMCIGYTYVPYAHLFAKSDMGWGGRYAPYAYLPPGPIWAICALYTLPPAANAYRP